MVGWLDGGRKNAEVEVVIQSKNWILKDTMMKQRCNEFNTNDQQNETPVQMSIFRKGAIGH